ncbi:MAG: hydrophobe/amphiphile efflux-3 (HAE3) family transporter [Chloroflexi bacterium]|nr:hydrophobe/amphiphile efflux-3 (HAE3) family transporter [Chloroflexota bacterium]
MNKLKLWLQQGSEAIAKFVENKWLLVIIAAIVLTAAAIPGITTLKAEGGLSQMVSPTSDIYRATERYKENFGSDSITIMLTGQLDLTGTKEPTHLAAIGQFRQQITGDTTRYYNFLGPQPIDSQHYIIQVTPVGNLSDKEQKQAATDIRQFFIDHKLNNITTNVVAYGEIMDAISNGIMKELAILVAIAVGIMILILYITFRVRWRLLSLIMVGVGSLWTFGIMGYLSIPVSMATMAVLPILIGLGIDYSIQFHNRYQEEVTRNGSVKQAIIAGVKSMLPVAGLAMIATVIGFVTLFISDIPMIRNFGMLLALGILLCYVVALFLTNSILYITDKKKPIEILGQKAVEGSHKIEKGIAKAVSFAIRKPLLIFLIALITGAAGGVLDGYLKIKTDLESLIPQDLPALVEMRQIRDISGAGTTLKFMVEANDVTSSEFLNWLKTYQEDEIAKYPAELKSANSPATLITEATKTMGMGEIIPSNQAVINGILSNIDQTQPGVIKTFISVDKKMAAISFSAMDLSLKDVNDLQKNMVTDADGVSISPVGSMALGAKTVDSIIQPRLLMNILCMGVTFIVLLLIYRNIMKTLFIVIPVGLVIGWLSLVLYITGIGLNPITAILGVVIVGINTEYMVLLVSRYDEEKNKGEPPTEAMITAASKMGRAIIASGLTTLGGFGVLIASKFVMMHDFGIVTLVGILMCMITTIIVMPPLMVWWDNWRLKRKLLKTSSKISI